MYEVLGWMIFLLALVRAAWLALAPERYLDFGRRRWQVRTTDLFGVTHARQQTRS